MRSVVYRGSGITVPQKIRLAHPMYASGEMGGGGVSVCLLIGSWYREGGKCPISA